MDSMQEEVILMSRSVPGFHTRPLSQGNRLSKIKGKYRILSTETKLMMKENELYVESECSSSVQDGFHDVFYYFGIIIVTVSCMFVSQHEFRIFTYYTY
jgi:hypothetical protein